MTHDLLYVHYFTLVTLVTLALHLDPLAHARVLEMRRALCVRVHTSTKHHNKATRQAKFRASNLCEHQVPGFLDGVGLKAVYRSVRRDQHLAHPIKGSRNRIRVDEPDRTQKQRRKQGR